MLGLESARPEPTRVVEVPDIRDDDSITIADLLHPDLLKAIQQLREKRRAQSYQDARTEKLWH